MLSVQKVWELNLSSHWKKQNSPKKQHAKFSDNPAMLFFVILIVFAVLICQKAASASCLHSQDKCLWV